MNWRSKLLYFDSFGGLSVGIVVLLLNQWLSAWYGLPRGFVIFMALLNILYGSYSFSLLVRTKRPLILIILLVIANLVWAILCVLWAASFAQTATLLFVARNVLCEWVGVFGVALP
jgi:hypothetical protein